MQRRYGDSALSSAAVVGKETPSVGLTATDCAELNLAAESEAQDSFMQVYCYYLCSYFCNYFCYYFCYYFCSYFCNYFCSYFCNYFCYYFYY